MNANIDRFGEGGCPFLVFIVRFFGPLPRIFPKRLLEASGLDFGSILVRCKDMWVDSGEGFGIDLRAKLDNIARQKSCYEFKWEKVFLPLAISCFIDLGSILRYSVGSGEGLGTDLRGKVW